ncbi:MAG: dihydroorotase [Firmicutes bacterium]|nr:dihydroorotase [Bacillota bacterium]MCM1401087.1 dihydroorotase [Bacteroides sp.]MCM1477006.1 dihydroorotase [Bacteroides sp.]
MIETERTLIHNVIVVNEGTARPGYVLTEGELIAATGEGDPDPELMEGCEVIDGRGRLLLPGVIDTHVHFRDPGLTHKADMESESRAAVTGGVTSFIDMPNTKPATVTVEALEKKLERASQASMANYGFFIGATANNIEELKSVDYTRCAGVKLFMGSSTGGMLVDSTDVMRNIMEQVPALMAVHAEDEALLKANREAVVARYGENLEMEFHPVIRNHAVCYSASAKAVAMARELNHRLHLLHVSTAIELDLLSPGPVDEKLITAETCPQYLAFSDEQYAMLGARIKCNPAIKRPADRDALRKAVNTGLIDTIATDHAPHLLEEKRGTALTAVSGMPLIQFSLTLMLQMAEEGLFDVTTIVEKMCHNPARLYGIEKRGFIRPGYYADLVMVDNDCEPYTITDAWAVSRCGWTPLSGLTVNNKVDLTMVNGKPAYRFGVLFSNVKGKELRFTKQN